MFCPQCGSSHSDDLKFCKTCGANLMAVRKAVESPETVERFNWNKTWLSEMLLSGEESVKRAAEIERLQGITPETKRRAEIKAGIITASVGAGVMVTTYMVMLGIVLGGFVSPAVAEILSRVWIAGSIPMLVGAALIFNGSFVSKKSDDADTGVRIPNAQTNELAEPPNASFLGPAETNMLGTDVYSVTDDTTQHLEEPVRSPRKSNS